MINQIHICTVHEYLPKEAVHQKIKKLSGRFWEINWKVDAAADGRIGIRKAPLPSGWRS